MHHFVYFKQPSMKSSLVTGCTHPSSNNGSSSSNPEVPIGNPFLTFPLTKHITSTNN